jgi:zinc protease
LLSLGLVGCSTAKPFFVEQPLARTSETAEDLRPPAAEFAQPKPPRSVEKQLPSGMSVEVVERPDTGLVSLIFVNPRARMSSSYLPVFLGDALLAGVQAGDGRALYPVTLDGRTPSIHTGLGGTTISLSCRAEQFERALDLLSAIARRPLFEPRLLEPIRARSALDLLGIRNSTWAWQLASAHRGEHFQVDEERIAESVRTLDTQGLQQAHRRLFGPHDTSLVVVGDVPAERVFASFQQRFGDWAEAPALTAATPQPKSERAAQTPPAPSQPQPTSPAVGRAGRKVLVVPEASYPYLSIIQDAPAFETPDALAFALLVDTLSAHNSPLMRKLRYQSAHVYFIDSRQVSVPERGQYLFLDTRVAERTLPSDLSELLKALSELRVTPVQPSELAGAKARYGASLAQYLASGRGLASYLASVRLRQAVPIRDLGQRISTITPDDLRRVAVRYLDPDHATIVVQGQVSSSLRRELGAFGEVSSP